MPRISNLPCTQEQPRFRGSVPPSSWAVESRRAIIRIGCQLSTRKFMNAQWITVKADDGGQYEVYLSLPPAGKGPGLVLFQEIFGVNRHIRAVADQYALDGFVVLAPDVFWRDAPRVELGYAGADMDKARALMTGAKPPQLLADI